MRRVEVRIMEVRGRSQGDWHTSSHHQKCELGTDISNSLTSVAKDNYIVEIYE